jgi:hypothetical protein
LRKSQHVVARCVLELCRVGLTDHVSALVSGNRARQGLVVDLPESSSVA